MRFYLVDRVTELNPGESIEGVKCWTMTDEIFQDHFPGMPMVPGVLLIESCAQLLGMLIEQSYAREHPDAAGVYVVLSIVHKAKFRLPVQPGDQCRLYGTLRTLDLNRATASARVLVESEVAAEVDLSFTMIATDKLPQNEHMSRRQSEYRDFVLNRGERRRL
jgi:3-hydroxymyristoyl/3-hydroxydecanoyl-(acyl carrier protein) dehydratase